MPRTGVRCPTGVNRTNAASSPRARLTFKVGSMADVRIGEAAGIGIGLVGQLNGHCSKRPRSGFRHRVHQTKIDWPGTPAEPTMRACATDPLLEREKKIRWARPADAILIGRAAASSAISVHRLRPALARDGRHRGRSA